MPKLNAKRVEALLRAGIPGEHADGGGLYMKVTGPGAGNWYHRAVTHGKRRKLGLGAGSDVKLAKI